MHAVSRKQVADASRARPWDLPTERRPGEAALLHDNEVRLNEKTSVWELTRRLLQEHRTLPGLLLEAGWAGGGPQVRVATSLTVSCPFAAPIPLENMLPLPMLSALRPLRPIPAVNIPNCTSFL